MNPLTIASRKLGDITSANVEVKNTGIFHQISSTRVEFERDETGVSEKRFKELLDHITDTSGKERMLMVPSGKVAKYKQMFPNVKIVGFQPLRFVTNYFESKYQKNKPLGNRGKKNTQYRTR